jgi:hypothetical protein
MDCSEPTAECCRGDCVHQLFSFLCDKTREFIVSEVSVHDCLAALFLGLWYEDHRGRRVWESKAAYLMCPRKGDSEKDREEAARAKI